MGAILDIKTGGLRWQPPDLVIWWCIETTFPSQPLSSPSTVLVALAVIEVVSQSTKSLARGLQIDEGLNTTARMDVLVSRPSAGVESARLRS